MASKIIDVLLGKSITAMDKKSKHGRITRRECFSVLSRGIGIDKKLSKMILKEMEKQGLIKNEKSGIRIRRKK